MKLNVKKIKNAYFSSFIYYFYTNYILAVPLFRIFIDTKYLSKKLMESFIFTSLFSLCEKILAKLPAINIELNRFCILALILLSVFSSRAAQVLTVLFSVIYIWKNKDSSFFAFSILFVMFLLLMSFYGAGRIANEALVLWCCGSVLYLSYNILKEYKIQDILVLLHYFNLIFCFTGRLYSEKIILYLMPFSLSYVAFAYEKSKRTAMFSFVILLSVVSGIKGGGVILSGIALEIILFCVIFKPKYIFAPLICTPWAIAALLRQILRIRREFLSAGVTFNNIVIAAYKVINNGFKGDIQAFGRAVRQSSLESFTGISFGEQFFIYSVLIIALITVFFSGRYIFSLIRKTVFMLKNENDSIKPVITGAISFFAGTSFVSLLSPASGSTGSMLIYWLLLGFIRTLHK